MTRSLRIGSIREPPRFSSFIRHRKGDPCRFRNKVEEVRKDHEGRKDGSKRNAGTRDARLTRHWHVERHLLPAAPAGPIAIWCGPNVENYHKNQILGPSQARILCYPERQSR